MRQNASQGRTETTIRHALLELMATKELGNVTVAELCRTANVSRGTFYAHYNNVIDVYAQLLEELTQKLCPLLPALGQPNRGDEYEERGGHVRCDELCNARGRLPFCQIARDAGAFEPITREDRFLGDLIDNAGLPENGDLEAYLMEHGYDWQQARVIRMFQMAGCFMVATRSHVGEGDWPRIRELIDRFIAGGIDALTTD